MKQYVVGSIDKERDGDKYISSCQVFDRFDEAVKLLRGLSPGEVTLYELVPLKKIRATIEVIDV